MKIVLQCIRVIVLCVIVKEYFCNSMGTPPDRLRITCWNSRGMTAAVPLLREIMRYSDIICLSEHWLHRNRLNMLDEICILSCPRVCEQ